MGTGACKDIYPVVFRKAIDVFHTAWRTVQKLVDLSCTSSTERKVRRFESNQNSFAMTNNRGQNPAFQIWHAQLAIERLMRLVRLQLSSNPPFVDTESYIHYQLWDTHECQIATMAVPWNHWSLPAGLPPIVTNEVSEENLKRQPETDSKLQGVVRVSCK